VEALVTMATQSNVVLIITKLLIAYCNVYLFYYSIFDSKLTIFMI